MDCPTHELEAYFAGDATAEQLRAVESWIHADPANARTFINQLRFRELVGERIRERRSDTGNVLAELARMEAAAPVVLRTVDVPKKQKKKKDPNALAAQDYANAARYVLRLALTSKPAKKFYGRVAVAAALLLAVTLLVVFTRDEPNDLNDAPYAGNPNTESSDPNKPAESAQPILRDQTVATLTAQHSAQWAPQPGGDHRPGALRQGTQLSAGQRLSLTAGFAEITTAQGAVAILQAPATIEFTHNDNALHLHAGKLVGICETESSKGFTVRTPHMDIIDLGTRFGVDASLSDATEVHVFEGEVEVAMSSSDILETKQTHLTAGQAVRAESAAERLIAIDQDRARFAALAEDGRSVLPLGASVHGIAALSGAAAWSPGSTYIGTDFEQWPQHDKVMVFEELSAHRLTSQVPVTLRTPSSTTDLETTSPATVIPAGTTVRSYILLLYPQTSGRYSGSVTFDGEVIGVATGDAQNRALADQATDLIRFSNSFPWIEAGSAEAVTLHNDRRTVSFEWGAGSTTTTDAVRVFVRVPAEDQP